MTLKIALATDNGIEFAAKHFGEANKYYIFEIDNNKAEYIKSIKNSSVKERMHADPAKAKSIVKILKGESVIAAVNIEFGPNIKRVKKHLVPVVIKEKNLDKALKQLIENYDILIESWKKGKKREALYI